MSGMKRSILAIAVFAGIAGSASPAVAACIPSAATNFCHATFNINVLKSSTFNNTYVTVTADRTALTTAGFNSTSGANANAPNSYSVAGMNYNIDGNGYGSVSIKALKSKITTLTWTAIQGGQFSFNWLVSGQSSQGAKAYVTINGVDTLLTQTATALSPTSGSQTLGVVAGQTISFRIVGTTQNLLNSAQLEVSAFKGVPEINGGILPLGVLLLGLMFIAVKRKDAVDGIDLDDAVGR